MVSLETKLHEAIQQGSVQDVQELILQGTDINAKNEMDETPLYVALKLDMVSIVDILLQHGADVNCQKPTALETPLHLAAGRGLEMVKVLISKGAKIEAKDLHGRTPFWCAALYGQYFNLEILYRNGANAEVQDHNGETPLMMAVMYACDKTVEVLIQMGVKLDTRDRQGQTAMHMATILAIRTSKLEKLVRYGASMKIRNHNGMTPLEFALKENAYKKRHPIKVLCYSAGITD